MKLTRAIKKIEHEVNELALDLIAIVEEHDSYFVSDDNALKEWIKSFSIGSLSDSLNYQKGNPLSNYSLRYLPHRPALRKLYEKTKEEYEKLNSELTVKKIDFILERIKSLDV